MRSRKVRSRLQARCAMQSLTRRKDTVSVLSARRQTNTTGVAKLTTLAAQQSAEHQVR